MTASPILSLGYVAIYVALVGVAGQHRGKSAGSTGRGVRRVSEAAQARRDLIRRVVAEQADGSHHLSPPGGGLGACAAWSPPCGSVYSQGIFTVLQYSSQVSPKVFDSSASSAGANIRDPMYRMMPISAPTHVLQMKPIHGSTRRATPV